MGPLVVHRGVRDAGAQPASEPGAGLGGGRREGRGRGVRGLQLRDRGDSGDVLLLPRLQGDGDQQHAPLLAVPRDPGGDVGLHAPRGRAGDGQLQRGDGAGACHRGGEAGGLLAGVLHSGELPVAGQPPRRGSGLLQGARPPAAGAPLHPLAALTAAPRPHAYIHEGARRGQPPRPRALRHTKYTPTFFFFFFPAPLSGARPSPRAPGALLAAGALGPPEASARASARARSGSAPAPPGPPRPAASRERRPAELGPAPSWRARSM